MIRHRWQIAVLSALWLLTAPMAHTQTADADPPAMLVADRMFVTADRKLVAEGHVEAFQGDIRMQASRVTFDRETGQLVVEGPIRIDQGGNVTVLASHAELDSGLQNGLLTGARMVFDRHVQLAALQMNRASGRYTQMYKTAVTSCRVCEDGRPPLWQIRARKVTHDQQEQQIYFEGAQLRILDVPMFYLPALRLPDPNLKRATGFLIPSVRSTSQLGIGVKVPYFFRIGDSKDLTLTPYLSSKTTTLGYRYRQAFRRGTIEINGAHTRDDLFPGEDRGYLFAQGLFNLRDGYRLSFDIKTTSDNAYLVDYGIGNDDRLKSEISLSRYRRDSAVNARLIHFKSLRDSEDPSTVPSRVADFTYERRFHPGGIGGEVRLGVSGFGFVRPSDVNVDGRDVAHGTVDLEWRRRWLLANGLIVDWTSGVAADEFFIRDDDTYPASAGVVTPRAALTFRYPMARAVGGGVTEYLEPILQAGWTSVSNRNVPLDEGTFQEFDQGNLLSLSRFPAADRRENGATVVYGLNWARHAQAGWKAAATIGQVFRSEAQPDFTWTSGLNGTSSDILLAGQFVSSDGLSLTARGLLSGSLDFSMAELRGGWNSHALSVAGTYVWLGRDPVVGRTTPVSEIWFDGDYDFLPNWSAGARLRYDTEGTQPIYAGFNLAYENECVTVDLSINRRYTSSTSVEPSTSFGLSVALSGFSVKGGAQNYRRTCSSPS
ncbi:LPS-assembly protein LptD [Jhaorihella thermophila]|uniref:LPS-assembly protein LptD n=1 Tax=Jhaorihella thermophila TaxID=488547 RepID=A0A1H5SMZ2_9RHOB|nr:LPS assembly protein LptD [Jhaorihella thermophila]SEF51956.1 LPS-assembly protein [Jhaorihella thermophila]